MKKLIAILLLLSFITSEAIWAQGPGSGKLCGGTYLNATDYAHGKLSFDNCTPCAKIRLNHFFSGNYIIVKCDEKKYKFNKDSIFGYRNSQHEDYRFYQSKDEEYRIMESKGLIIYKYPIYTYSWNKKHYEYGIQYFFSKTPNSPIYPLTVLNLKRAFPDNLKFHDMLDLAFGDGENISEYYANGNEYKVNYLLEQSTFKQQIQ